MFQKIATSGTLEKFMITYPYFFKIIFIEVVKREFLNLSFPLVFSALFSCLLRFIINQIIFFIRSFLLDYNFAMNFNSNCFVDFAENL